MSGRQESWGGRNIKKEKQTQLDSFTSMHLDKKKQHTVYKAELLGVLMGLHLIAGWKA